MAHTRVLVALLFLSGCTPTLDFPPAEQVLQSGITTTGERTAVLTQVSDLPGPADIVGAMRISATELEVASVGVPVYFYKPWFDEFFANREGKIDPAIHADVLEDILDVEALLQSADRSFSKLIRAAFRKLLAEVGIDVGAEVEITASVVRFNADGDRTELVSGQRLVKATNILPRDPSQDVDSAPFVYHWPFDASNTDLEWLRRLSEVQQGEVVVPVVGAAAGGVYELDLTVTQRSNISRALEKGIKALKDAVTNLNVNVGALGGGELAGKVAGQVFKFVMNELENKLAALAASHESRDTYRIFLSGVPRPSQYDVEIYLQLDLDRNDLVKLKIVDPLRPALAGDSLLSSDEPKADALREMARARIVASARRLSEADPPTPRYHRELRLRIAIEQHRSQVSFPSARMPDLR